MILHPLALVLALVVGPFMVRAGAAAAAPGDAPAVVAHVDGVPVAAPLFRMYVKNGIAALGLDAATAEGRRRISLLEQGVIDELIDRTLIAIEARRRNVVLADEEVSRHQKGWIDRLGGERKYRAYLEEHGLTEQDFRGMVEQELYGGRMRAELTRDVQVAEREIAEFYVKHRTDPSLAALFVEREKVTASHILVAARRSLISRELRDRRGLAGAALEAAVREEIGRRRARAEALRRQVLGGADFAEMARKWSEDPGSRHRGGDLGAFTRNAHTAKFDEAAFALKPHAISDIVETEYGFHIIRVSDRTPARARTLDELRSEIRERLLAGKGSEQLAEWLAAARRRADIRVDPYYSRRTAQDERSRP